MRSWTRFTRATVLERMESVDDSRSRFSTLAGRSGPSSATALAAILGDSHHTGRPVEEVVGVEALEEFVTAERLSELEEGIIEGESLTPEELAAWRKLAAEDILSENPDGDVYAIWAVRRVAHSDGRVACVADLGVGQIHACMARS